MSSEDGGGRGGDEAAKEGGGGHALDAHEALQLGEVLRLVLGYVGDGHFGFVGGVSTEWRAHYTALYPASTTFGSVVSSAERLRWARSRGLPLSKLLFRHGARAGDVDTCVALHGMGCPWDGGACESTVQNGRHGLSVLQWLRSEALPEKERCPWYPNLICGRAAGAGHLAILEWLLHDDWEEGGPPPCRTDTLSWMYACEGGNVHVVHFLLNHPRTRRVVPGPGPASMPMSRQGAVDWRHRPFGAYWGAAYAAAHFGHHELLRYLHAKARHLCFWNETVCQAAVANARSLAMLKWLRSEGVQCPWDERCCPQVIRDSKWRGRYDEKWTIDEELFQEIKEWVHANGHPCDCPD